MSALNERLMRQMPDIRALLLAAGLGTRLRPLTDIWPKCLMPIGDRPLLEYWLETMHKADIQQVLVNLHHHEPLVTEFLNRTRFDGWVKRVYEPQLLGTAGTLRSNYHFFSGNTVLLVHADNWCQTDFGQFLSFHRQRPDRCCITMMTFDTASPQSCGIVEVDDEGVVIGFHEKVANPPGTRANAAVYLLEPEVLDWLMERPSISDFSTEVLPEFVGRIATWHNAGIHRDIGTISSLVRAQQDNLPQPLWPESDAWHVKFLEHPVHGLLKASKHHVVRGNRVD